MHDVALFPVYGLWGGSPMNLSHGVDDIADTFTAAHPNVVRHASREYYEDDAICDEIDKLPARALVAFVAHSNGAHTATVVARRLTGRRFVIVGIDPTWIWPMRPVPLGHNVIAALSIVGRANGSLCGHAALECAEGVSVPIERIETETGHAQIDDDPAVQAACLAFLDRVTKGV